MTHYKLYNRVSCQMIVYDEITNIIIDIDKISFYTKDGYVYSAPYEWPEIWDLKKSNHEFNRPFKIRVPLPKEKK